MTECKGVILQGKIELDFGGRIPVTLRLAEGSGPIVVSGSHEKITEAEVNSDDDADEPVTEEEELSEDDSPPPRAVVRRHRLQPRALPRVQQRIQQRIQQRAQQGVQQGVQVRYFIVAGKHRILLKNHWIPINDQQRT